MAYKATRPTAATLTGWISRIARAAGIPRHISRTHFAMPAIFSVLDAGVPSVTPLPGLGGPPPLHRAVRASTHPRRPAGVYALTAYVAGGV